MSKEKAEGNVSGQTDSLKLVIEDLCTLIDKSESPFGNRKLIELCRSYVGTLTIVDPHIYHEIAETALNFLIKKHYAGNWVARAQAEPIKFIAETLKPLAERLPTQTWRSREQTIRQQFSTPPAIAYLLWHLVNCREGETVLEPSAGTGTLIVWSHNAIFCNEIDPRRREMLRVLDFSPTAFDAEFINDYLSPEIRPDCLLMNPPFSSSGGRTERNSSRFGFRHVESALERLKKGGKFGIILGEAAGLDTKTGSDLWSSLSERVEVKAVIKINGREYYKNGTTVDINLIIGEKLLAARKIDWRKTMNQIVCVSARTVEEAFEQAQKLNLRLSQ